MSELVFRRGIIKNTSKKTPHLTPQRNHRIGCCLWEGLEKHISTLIYWFDQAVCVFEEFGIGKLNITLRDVPRKSAADSSCNALCTTQHILCDNRDECGVCVGDVGKWENYWLRVEQVLEDFKIYLHLRSHNLFLLLFCIDSKWWMCMRDV